jgi:hypothetical protein
MNKIAGLILVLAVATPPLLAQESPSSPQTVPTPPTAATPVVEPASPPPPTATTPVVVPTSPAAPVVVPASTAPPVSTKPAGPPPGFDAAVKLYQSRKFPAAAAKFEGFIKAGTADDETHSYLAGSYQLMNKYSKAAKEYEWLAANAKSMTMRRKAQESAQTLRLRMRGICPMPCLKRNDPRWQRMIVAGHPPTDMWIKFNYRGGSGSFSQRHMGHIIQSDGSHPPRDVGACPVCQGSGRVPVLKDK